MAAVLLLISLSATTCAAASAIGASAAASALGGSPPPQYRYEAFVAPNGSDVSGDGTLGLPFATLARARDALRQARTAGGPGGAALYLRGGVYSAACALAGGPLQLTAADSGTPGAPTVISAYNGEAATVSAGVEVGGWAAAAWPGAPAGAVWAAPLPPGAGRNGTLLAARLQTAADGPLLVKSARWPPPPPPGDYGSPSSWAFTQGWTSAPGGGSSDPNALWPWDVGVSAAAFANASSGAATDVWLELFGTTERDVLSQLVRVTAAAAGGQPKLTVSLYGGKGAMPPATRLAAWNVKAALAPGSMYTDSASGTVYLWLDPAWARPGGGAAAAAVSAAAGTAAGALPNGLALFAPLWDRAVDVNGCEWLTVANLTLTDTNFGAEGFWIGPAISPSDAAIVISASENVRITACSFVAGCGGYGVGVTGVSSDVSVDACLFDHMGQGGVTLYGANEPAPSTQPFGVRVTGNVMADLGLLLKHVAGVVLRSASNCVVAHNRISRSPRYALQCDGFIQPGLSRLSLNNVFEYNVITGACTETDDCGAIEVLGSGSFYYSGNVFRYNNVSDVVDASSSDGATVCVHDSPKGSPSCRNMAWSIYLDGAESGSTIYGNVLDGAVSGAIFLNCGGDNNISNNVIVGGLLKQLDMGSPQPGVPGDVFTRNLVYFNTSAMILGAEVAWQHTKLSYCDNNLYFSPSVDVNTSTAGRALFPYGGAGLVTWVKTTGFDQLTLAVDPLFVDPASGDFALQPDSPAWALGWVAIPPIDAPHADSVGAPRPPNNSGAP